MRPRIVDAATRLLDTVTRRASEFTDDKEVAAFFATDQLTSRVRELADELDELDDAGRAAEVRGGLRDAMEEARRRIRDKAALVSDDGAVVLGGVRLAQNTQPFEMVLSSRANERGADSIAATITATDFAVDVSESLQEFTDLLGRSFPSETPGEKGVSRSEYLAWAVLETMSARPGGLAELLTATANPTQIDALCQAEAERRHGDGYQRGVHDQDAARILAAVMPALEAEPLLRFTGLVRGLARLWLTELDPTARAGWVAKATAADTAAQRLGATGPTERLVEEARHLIGGFVEASDAPESHRAVFGDIETERAAEYLVAELAVGADVIESSTATALVAELRGDLGDDGVAELEVALASEDDAVERFVLARDWVAAYVHADDARADRSFDIAEAAAILATPDAPIRSANQGGAITVTGLVADHPRIVEGQLVTRTDELAEGAGALFAEMQERWPAYSEARRRVVEEQRGEVRLDEHRPQVMSGFVRNTLIDTALLPLFGPNLGRQLGTVDPTDIARQGLLVVVSPPGYGKTTLMEWIADRLGLLIVKVNGPALGHDTTSLDPADAPNAAARAEVEKINLAFGMGRNVMLYLDDIQHTSPVLLSRFIPLADATRRIEGVTNGEPTTFDLRGKRFCVVMAGNPYTTGGGRFEMPDMLVNRSDVFNLGDVSGEHDDAFAKSYIENSLTACPSVAPHASKLLDDLGPVLQMASGRTPVETSGLEHAWDGAELDSTVRSVSMLQRAQDVLLKVNAAYIASAATSEDDRVAPPVPPAGLVSQHGAHRRPDRSRDERERTRCGRRRPLLVGGTDAHRQSRAEPPGLQVVDRSDERCRGSAVAGDPGPCGRSRSRRRRRRSRRGRARPPHRRRPARSRRSRPPALRTRSGSDPDRVLTNGVRCRERPGAACDGGSCRATRRCRMRDREPRPWAHSQRRRTRADGRDEKRARRGRGSATTVGVAPGTHGVLRRRERRARVVRPRWPARRSASGGSSRPSTQLLRGPPTSGRARGTPGTLRPPAPDRNGASDRGCRIASGADEDP